MKKLFIFLVFCMGASTSFAQTEQGSILIETGISPVTGDLTYKAPTTGFSLLTSDGFTYWSLGAEAGYFVMDDLALKLGLGYSDLDGDGFFAYKVGGKYYINSVIPVQLDFTGATNPNIEGFDTPDPFWLGLQGGYAAFVSDNIAIEPALRYNISLNSDYSEEGMFEIRVGFVVFL